jgi:alpha-L-fucosidase 2
MLRAITVAILLFCASAAAAADADPRLWYTKPAGVWEEALPVGSGRLGAMVFGIPADERIQFNEDTLWTGKPHDYARAGAADVLKPIQDLIFAGEISDAVALVRARFLSDPVRQKAFQPFGDLHLRFPGHEAATDYVRELNLRTAVAITRYRVGQTHFRREVFASYPDNAIVIRITADQPAAVTFTVGMDSPHKLAQTTAIGPDSLCMTGQVLDLVPPYEPGVRFQSRLRAIPTGGHVAGDGDSLAIKNADSVTLILVAATSFNNFHDISGDPAARCQKYLAAIEGKSYDALVQDHIADHQSLFNRVTLDLRETPAGLLPTDERLGRVIAGGQPALDADPGLAALFFQYGRYMLISSSRPGTQSANLQGVWNPLLNPPWESKYTTNINVEMNYWPAEVTNLSECAQPLFDLISDLTVTGHAVAAEQYSARGWVVNHNTDIWRGAAPINNIDGVWPTGGAWLCQHLWEHYLFTLDKDFLANQAYPAMKGACLFFVDTLVKDPRTGYLVTSPSFSPEQGSLCAGPAMDMQLIRALFAHTLAAEKILNTDGKLFAELTELLPQLAPDKIGSHGQLQEWQDDVDKPNNNHRHMSPLWGLYPGDEFSPADPKVFAAAKLLLQWRGDGSTGWSYAWRICLWARAGDGEAAYHQLFLQLAKKTFPDLFDKCGPFQVDGNFGATAGIAEMLVQSQWGKIVLLPALPAAWPDGSVTGLCARGGYQIDMTWKNRAVTSATIRCKFAGPCTLRFGEREISFSASGGGSYRFNGL